MMNKIDILTHRIVDYYDNYYDDYIGKIYKNKEEAFNNVNNLLNCSTRNQVQEMLNEINHLFLNSDLIKGYNKEQLQASLEIALGINELMYDKTREMEV